MVSSKQIRNELREKAEAQAKKSLISYENLGREEARILLHELEVHQIELEMQNTELRDTQVRLEKEKDEYTNLFDFAPIGYLILDEKGIIVNINLTGCNLLNTERVRIKGSPFSTYLSSEGSRTMYLKLKEAFKTGSLPPFDLQLFRNGGTPPISILIQGTVTANEKENRPQCRISIQDVTELRKAEKLQEEKLRIQRYFDLAPVVFLLLDPGYNVRMINQKGCDLLGYERIQVQGKNWFENFIVPMDKNGGESTDTDFCHKKMLLKPYCECYIVRKNGEQRLIAWTNSSLLDNKGNIIGTICSGEDITDRRKEDTGKQVYVQELEKIVKGGTRKWNSLKAEKNTYEMNSRFLMRASREMRSGLAKVSASVKMIERYSGPGQHKKQIPHITKVKSGVNRLNSMFNNFVLMDRLDREKVKIGRSAFDLEMFIKGINEGLEGALQNGQEINYQHHGDLEVVTDRNILRNVITNLMDNAIKYSDLDITVKTMVHDGLLIASIKDRGIGIPKEDQQYIFMKYYRAKNATNIRGIGIGLTVVQLFVSLMGGTIDFSSAIKSGSTFTVILPLDGTCGNRRV